jgi:PhnB protein
MKNIKCYLNFNGECRDAMNFYKDCFGGELELITFEGSPMAAKMPTAAAAQGIMHSTLKMSNGTSLMASDGMPGQESASGGGQVTLYLESESLEQQQQYYDALSQGGNITMPLEDTFWGTRFGQVTDKFGINWMFDHALPK